jgi:hypothetical protein
MQLLTCFPAFSSTAAESAAYQFYFTIHGSSNAMHSANKSAWPATNHTVSNLLVIHDLDPTHLIQ